MPETKTPGVYVEEVQSGATTIAGAQTSTAAFVGETERGPVNEPVTISSFSQFEHQFGFKSDAELTLAASQFFLNGGQDAVIVRATSCEPEGQQDALSSLRDTAFNLLSLPGASDPGMLSIAASLCEKRRAFLIIDAPRACRTPKEVIALTAGHIPKSDNAAIYYPWTTVVSPQNGDKRETAPSGSIAGLYARTDGERGVWKAPAGVEASLKGVLDLAHSVNDDDNGLLNSHAVNALRGMPGRGAVAWGARTVQGSDGSGSEWKYVPVRRTALFIEESLYKGLQWAVFEPNGEALWSQIRAGAGGFMEQLFRQGAFQGQKQEDAWFVRCGSDTMTKSDIDQGIVNLLVGFAPLKPAEFVVLKLQLKAAS